MSVLVAVDLSALIAQRRAAAAVGETAVAYHCCMLAGFRAWLELERYAARLADSPELEAVMKERFAQADAPDRVARVHRAMRWHLRALTFLITSGVMR
jgi:hypothetical protein